MPDFKMRLDGVLGSKFRIIVDGPHAGDPLEIVQTLAAFVQRFATEYQLAIGERKDNGQPGSGERGPGDTPSGSAAGPPIPSSSVRKD